MYSLSLIPICTLEIMMLAGNPFHQDVITNSMRHSKIVSKHCLIGGGTVNNNKNLSYQTSQMPLMTNNFLAIHYKQVIVYCAFPLFLRCSENQDGLHAFFSF